jgi:transcriptional activator SPT7
MIIIIVVRNGIPIDPRPRKRSRKSSSTPGVKHRVELWWDVVQSDLMLANGLPVLVHSSSDPSPTPNPSSQLKEPSFSATSKRKKRRKRAGTNLSTPKTLLRIMNNNIRTMHRLRHIHSKFSSIKESNEESGLALPGTAAAFSSPPEPVDLSSSPVPGKSSNINPWTKLRLSNEGGSGIDIGSELADKCLHWMGGKVLEHVGFQGLSAHLPSLLFSVLNFVARFLQGCVGSLSGSCIRVLVQCREDDPVYV